MVRVIYASPHSQQNLINSHYFKQIIALTSNASALLSVYCIMWNQEGINSFCDVNIRMRYTRCRIINNDIALKGLCDNFKSSILTLHSLKHFLWSFVGFLNACTYILYVYCIYVCCRL